jgi:hypothetical protein
VSSRVIFLHMSAPPMWITTRLSIIQTAHKQNTLYYYYWRIAQNSRYLLLLTSNTCLHVPFESRLKPSLQGFSLLISGAEIINADPSIGSFSNRNVAIVATNTRLQSITPQTQRNLQQEAFLLGEPRVPPNCLVDRYRLLEGVVVTSPIQFKAGHYHKNIN